MENKKYENPAAELFKKHYPVLPSNCVFNKVVTGCGATTIEIENLDRDSIITVPFRSLIDNKVEQYKYKNERTPEDFELFGVQGDVTFADIESYLKRNKGCKNKFIVTWDSLQKLTQIIDKLNAKYGDELTRSHKDYFLLVDEVHVMLNNYVFRKKAIRKVLDNYKTFNNWCFLTATPHGADFILEELKGVRIEEANMMEPEKVILQNFEVTDLYNSTKEIIDYHLKEEETTHAHIFVNSVIFIAGIVKRNELKSDDCKIVWGESNKKYKIEVLGIKRGTTGSEAKKINFYTSTCFEGCDIYDKEGKIYIISDGYQTQTMSDIQTTFRQITGRIRNTRYKSPIIHLYRKNQNNADDLSYDEYKNISKIRAREAFLLAKSYNVCEVFDEEEAILMKHYIVKEEDEYLKFRYDPNLWRHDLLHYKITHEDYLSIYNIRKEQEKAGMIAEAIKIGDNLKEEPEIDPEKMSFQKAYKIYTQLNNRPRKELKGDERELIKRFENNHPYLLRAYKLLGKDKLEEFEFNTQRIERELDGISDQPLRSLIRPLILIKLRHLNIKIKKDKKEQGNFISLVQGKDILSEIYKKLRIKKSAIAKDLMYYYFSAKDGRRRVNGKMVNGYYLNGVKELKSTPSDDLSKRNRFGQIKL